MSADDKISCPACRQGVRGAYSASTGASHTCAGEGALSEFVACPFCDGPLDQLAAIKRPYDYENWFVWCADCKAEGPDGFATRAEAIAAWNTRPVHATKPQQVLGSSSGATGTADVDQRPAKGEPKGNAQGIAPASMEDQGLKLDPRQPWFAAWEEWNADRLAGWSWMDRDLFRAGFEAAVAKLGGKSC